MATHQKVSHGSTVKRTTLQWRPFNETIPELVTSNKKRPSLTTAITSPTLQWKHHYQYNGNNNHQIEEEEGNDTDDSSSSPSSPSSPMSVLTPTLIHYQGLKQENSLSPFYYLNHYQQQQPQNTLPRLHHPIATTEYASKEIPSQHQKYYYNNGDESYFAFYRRF